MGTIWPPTDAVTEEDSTFKAPCLPASTSDKTHDALVPYSVLDKFHQPFVSQASEEVTNVGVEYPVHLPRRDTGRECIQRLMRAASWSEAVREPAEVLFADGVHHLDDRALDDLVFQRRYSERPLPPIHLRDVRSTNRLRPVCTSLQPFGKVQKVVLQILPVVPPCLAVDACRRVSLGGEVRRAQAVNVVHVVQERRELLLPVLSRPGRSRG